MGTETFCGFKAQSQGKQFYIYGKEGKFKLTSTCQYGYCIMEQDVSKVRTGTDSKTQWKPDNSNPTRFSTITGLAIAYFVIRWTLEISLKATLEMGRWGNRVHWSQLWEKGNGNLLLHRVSYKMKKVNKYVSQKCVYITHFKFCVFYHNENIRLSAKRLLSNNLWTQLMKLAHFWFQNDLQTTIKPPISLLLYYLFTLVWMSSQLKSIKSIYQLKKQMFCKDMFKPGTCL